MSDLLDNALEDRQVLMAPTVLTEILSDSQASCGRHGNAF